MATGEVGQVFIGEHGIHWNLFERVSASDFLSV